MSTHAPLRLAIVGCGRIAHFHAAAIAALPNETRLVAAVDPDLARAREFAAKHGAAVALGSVAEAVTRDDVDAVVVCSPNAMHAANSIEALDAGKHVLLEKPMAENVAQAEGIAAAAHRAGRLVALGHTMRHTPSVRWFQDHRHEFGELRAVQVSKLVRWDGPQVPWWKTRTREEGLIMSLYAPHALDFVQGVFEGEQPTNVHCEVARFQRDWLAEDEAMVLLRYPRGRLAQVHISYNQRFVVDRYTMHFANAMVRLEHGEFAWVNDEQVLAPAASGADYSKMGNRDFTHWFATQLQEFVNAVRGRPHRSVLHDEGVHLARLMDRAIADGIRNAPEL
jgi:predicted dehydrogenase